MPLSDLTRDGLLGPRVSFFAPDLRGRGTSRRPAADVHTMALLADNLTEDIEELLPGAEPIVLLGLSMGGYVLLELLRRHRRRFAGRLRGLALCDTRAGADDAAGRERRLEAIAAIRDRGMIAASEAMLPKLLAPASRGGDAEWIVRDMVLSTPPATACADLAGMAVREDGFEALEAFEGAVLLAVGEEDEITPPADAEAMAEALDAASYVRLLTVPGAGHLAPLEKPREVAAGLADLLRRAGRPS